jgi:hypothetical protein
METGNLGFSPRVPWGVDTTIHAGEPAMSGEKFNQLRQQAADKRARVQGVATDLVSVLANAGLPKVAAQALCRKISELEGEVEELKNQVTLLRGLPPFMKNAEQR